MEEELLRQILQEIQSQSGTSWLDFLQLMIPALVGLVAGLAGAGVGIYSVRRSSESQLAAVRLATEADVDKISIERRLEWRRERYLELVNALSEFITALESMLEANMRYATSMFDGTKHEDNYRAIYDDCLAKFESVRSSGRLSEGRLKIGDQEIGDLVLTLTEQAEHGYLEMNGFIIDRVTEFEKSRVAPRDTDGYWPREHADRRRDFAKRTHEISELVERRISLSN